MKRLLGLVLVVVPALAHGQRSTGTTADPVAHATGAFFAVSVADLAASTKWYAETLGLKRVKEGDLGGRPGFVVLEGGGLIVELLRQDNGVRPGRASEGLFKAGAIVADFDRAAAMLRERGVEFVVPPVAARETDRANLVFKDNSGNLIQLFGDYARK